MTTKGHTIKHWAGGMVDCEKCGKRTPSLNSKDICADCRSSEGNSRSHLTAADKKGCLPLPPSDPPQTSDTLARYGDGWGSSSADKLREAHRVGCEQLRGGISGVGYLKELATACKEPQQDGSARVGGDPQEVGATEVGGRNSKVVVLGDGMVDVYIMGTAERLSSEVPIPVVKVEKQVSLPGGAGNVRRNLQALGVETVPCYNLGPTKYRLMVGDHQLARWDESDQCQPWGGDYPKADAVVIADYGKGSINEISLMKLAGFKGPVFIDTKQDPTILAWPLNVEHCVFFPNLKEYQQYKKQYNQMPRVVLKQGSQGMAMLAYGKEIAQFPTVAVKVVSVNGAGDTAMAAYVAYVVKHQPQPDCREALRYANIAAGLVVEKPLTSTVTDDEIQQVLDLERAENG